MKPPSTFADRALAFYKGLRAPRKLPAGIKVMNPYVLPEVQTYVAKFLQKYFADNRDRVFVFGINPGRFGAGLTGITFTDPVAMEKFCGIDNALEKRRELSSVFVYDFIQRWGGPEKFYRDFFLTAISPLGFMCNGKNCNYYDTVALVKALKPFIVRTLQDQITIGARKKSAILLGRGQNQKFFNAINREYGFFDKVYALDHPRFILQYRRKKLADYLERYEETFSRVL